MEGSNKEGYDIEGKGAIRKGRDDNDNREGRQREKFKKGFEVLFMALECSKLLLLLFQAATFEEPHFYEGGRDERESTEARVAWELVMGVPKA